MNSKKRFEVIGGLTTGLLGFFVIPIWIRWHHTAPLTTEALPFGLLFFYVPAFLFTAACVAHALTNNRLAWWLILVTTGFYAITLPYLFLICGYGGGPSAAFKSIVPALIAIITVLAARLPKLK
jgi:peptidoglycan/LPS O-acetylase OafA/YrhL